MTGPGSTAASALEAPTVDWTARWRVPDGQRFAFAEFDDGIMMFDARVGGTHLISASAAEALDIIGEHPDLASDQIHRRLLERTALDESTLTLAAIDELLWHLENLGLIVVVATPRES